MYFFSNKSFEKEWILTFTSPEICVHKKEDIYSKNWILQLARIDINGPHWILGCTTMVFYFYILQ